MNRNLVAYWPFSEGMTGHAVTADASGHGHPGTLVQFPQFVVSPVGWVPEVRLNGANPLTNELHTAFTDPGATVWGAVAGIAGGYYHSLALKADGTVVAWGRNDYGQTNVPVSVNSLSGPIVVSGTVDTNTPGSYTLTYTATNWLGVVMSTHCTVVVWDTPPTLTLLGSNPLVWPVGTIWSDPGATATDTSLGDLTASVMVAGSVNVNVLGTYTLTYSVTDASNTSTTNRMVLVASAPTISGLAAAFTATNAVTGARSVAFAATVNPNGLATAWFEYGLSTDYPGRSPVTNLVAVFTGTNLTASLESLMSGHTYHWRVVATNVMGATASTDQSLSVPALYAPGDLNGDGVVSAGELNAVLANYCPTSPWLELTNAAGLGGTNVTFALTNDLAGAFTVEYSTNLTDWLPLGPATPRYGFTDTNAPAAPQRFYRLRAPP